MYIFPLIVLVSASTAPGQCQPTLNCVKQQNVPCEEMQASSERRQMYQDIQTIMATLGDMRRDQRLIRDEIVCGKESLRHTYSGTQYMLVLSKVTWREARVKCHMCGYRLAQIDSQEKHDGIRTWLNSNVNIIRGHMTSHSVWIDGTDAGHEGCWVWTSEPVTPIPPDYRPWVANQPDNFANEEHCKTLREGREWRWNDLSCLFTTIYLCEKETPQSDTINILPEYEDIISPTVCEN